MSITQDDFKKIWASTSSVPEYTFSDADYQDGWEFVGNLPPTRAMWDTLQRRNDQKMKYLQDNGSMCFDSVSDMVASNLEAGQTALTKGYYTPNDGGNAFYYIREKTQSDVDDGGSIIILNNGNVAELITDGTVRPEQFGAYADGTHDDHDAITNAYAYAKTKNIKFCMTGRYLTQNTLTFDELNVYASNSYIIADVGRDKPCIVIDNARRNIYEFGYVLDVSAYAGGGDYDYESSYHGWADDNYAGIRCSGAWARISATAIIDFTSGLQLVGVNGWNTFDISTIRNCKYEIHIINDTADSWHNANRFVGIEMSYAHGGTSFITANVDRYCIYQEVKSGAHSSCNSNVFENCCFEWHHDKTYICGRFETLLNSVFLNCRFELPGSGAVPFIFDTSNWTTTTSPSNKIIGKTYTTDGVLQKTQVIRNALDRQPSTYECIADVDELYWCERYRVRFDSSDVIKIANNHCVLRRTASDGIYQNNFSHQKFDMYIATPFVDNYINSSAAYAVVLYVTLNNAKTLKICSATNAPSIQCFDSNGDILQENGIYSNSYGIYVNNATYNYTPPVASGIRVAYVSFKSAVKYVKLLFSQAEEICVLADDRTCVVSPFYDDGVVNPAIYNGFKTDVVPSLTDNIPLGTLLWDMRSGNVGKYWCLEKDNGTISWVYYS